MQIILHFILRSRRYIIDCKRTNGIPSCSKLFSIFQRGMEVSSDLARIDVKDNDPIVLFREWLQDAKTFSTGTPNAFCLATVSSDGKVTARHLILRRLDDDGFVMMTDRRSDKVKDLNEVPSVAMCFHWGYKRDTEELISRQVRIDGSVTELERKDLQELYDREPIACKIRSHICNQGTKVDWNELKASHDQLLQKVKRGEATLPMPDHVIGYKLIPSSIEFYHAHDQTIADRVLFRNDPTTGDWNHHHRAA